MEIKVNTRINGKRAVVMMQAEESQIAVNEQVVDDNGLLLSEIERLKSELQESDYKVIKCAEAICLNGELPYNMTELHNERQALRDKINELEKAMGNEWCNECQLFYFEELFIYAIVFFSTTRWC